MAAKGRTEAIAPSHQYEEVAMSDTALIERDEGKEGWAPPSKRAVALTVSSASMGFFLFGYDTGIVSAALFYVSAKQNFDLDTGTDQETFVSSCIAAAIVGASLVSICDKLVGRKTIVLVSATLFTIGALLMAFCPVDMFWLLIVGRAIIGLAIGASSTVVPVYISEMAPANIRGCLAVTNTAFCTGGQLMAAVIAYGLTFLDPTISWRYMLGIGAIPAIGQAISFSFMPESPRWLLLKGQREKAFAALKRLKRPDASHEAIGAELSYMADALAAERSNTMSARGACGAICSSSRLLRLLFVGCFLQFTQQIAGINTIMYYGSQIVQVALLNVSSTEPSSNYTTAPTNETDLSSGHVVVLVTAGFGFMNFLFTLVGIYLADRFARRRLTLSSLVLVVIALAGTGVAFFLGRTYIALAGCGVYLAFFAYGMGPMPWTINAELYPLSVRGLSTGISTMTNWISNMLVSRFFLNIITAYVGLFPSDSSSAASNKGVACTLWTLSVVTTLCTLVIHFLLPETGKASLEDIGRRAVEGDRKVARTDGHLLEPA